MSEPKVTPWFQWPTRPVRVGWYDFIGFLMSDTKRMYWNGSQWGYWFDCDWIHVADCATDRWRGLAEKP
ncbi:MAG: hypothetical protein NUV51_03590 [Sulfuricaulis sp.]|nr:hypothetical protein [Sulfuricaulis sp.]